MQWTINKAAQEFGVSRETLRKRLTVAEIPKAETYSTKEICRAVFGDIDSERLRLVREQADKIAIENAVARGELSHTKTQADKVGRAITSIKTYIMSASNLEREDKEKILKCCGELWDAAFGVSQADSSSVEPTAPL